VTTEGEEDAGKRAGGITLLKPVSKIVAESKFGYWPWLEVAIAAEGGVATDMGVVRAVGKFRKRGMTEFAAYRSEIAAVEGGLHGDLGKARNGPNIEEK